MFTVFQNLLPRALAWRTTVDTTLRRYIQGLAGFASEVRLFIDLVYRDLFPEDTRELPQWEDQFALVTTGTEATRRARLDAAWKAQGGQSPDYIETQLQLAGFDIWIHEWFEDGGPPYVARDPRDYTDELLFGFYQCEGSTPWECFDPGPGEALAPHCDDTLFNDPGYIVNLDLTRRAPPAIPSDPAFWPYFLYFGGETFPDPAYIDADRLDELKEKILQLRPSQQWAVLIVEAIPAMASLLYRFAVDHTTSYEGGTADDLRRIVTAPNIGTLGGATGNSPSFTGTAATFPEGRAAYFSSTQNVGSDLPASTWNALHNATGVVTLALRFRVFDEAALHGLLNTSGNTLTNPGIDIQSLGGFVDVIIGKGAGASQTLTVDTGGSGDAHTIVIVKNGLNVDLYYTDMSTPDSQIVLSAPSAADPSGGGLIIGGHTGVVSNAWIPEVMIYDFAATEEQREAIAEHLEKWQLAPTRAEYIAKMVPDGLAHYFDGVDYFNLAGEWTDTITGGVMVLDGVGSRSGATLDGHAAFTITAPMAFHAAGVLANGTNKAFTIFTYASILTPGAGSLWEFNSSATAIDNHGWPIAAATSRVSRQANGTTQQSSTVALASTARNYTHVFRGANDSANLVRVDALQNAPGLNCNPLASNEFRLLPGASGVTYAFLVMFDRALSEGDLRALEQLIQREL